MYTYSGLDQIIVALEQIKPELQSLVGRDGWMKIGEAFIEKLNRLQKSADEKEKGLLATELMTILWDYPKANERFHAIHADTDVYLSTLKNLAFLVEQMGGDAEILDQFTIKSSQSTSTQRLLLIPPSGIGKTKTIKVSNLEFDFGEFGELAAGIMFTIKNIVGEANHLFMAAGVLLVAAKLHKAVTKEISEQEATVFWGFIQACDEEKRANKASILVQTNSEREKVGLNSLNENQVASSLVKLKTIKCVEEIDSKSATWRILERYYVKG